MRPGLHGAAAHGAACAWTSHLEAAISLLKACIMSSAIKVVPEASASNSVWARAEIISTKQNAAKATGDMREQLRHSISRHNFCVFVYSCVVDEQRAMRIAYFELEYRYG